MENNNLTTKTLSELMKKYEFIEPVDQQTWLSGFNGLSFTDKKKTLSTLWHKSEILTTVRKTLFERLTDAYQVKTEYGLAIIYIMVDNEENSVQVYIGWEPTRYELPPVITDFYNEVHNGFVEIYSHAMGLLPEQEIEHYDKDEWEFKLTDSSPEQIIVFRDGGGGYLLLNPETGLGSVIYVDDEPEEKVDFSAELDDWTLIGINE